MVADWPAVLAASGRPELPVAVLASRVISANQAARREGVVPGLRRREAQARCPHLVLVRSDPDKEGRGWEPVLRAVESQVAPNLEVAAAGELCLEAKGPSRYFGGEQALAEKLLKVVQEAVGGHCAKVGAAPGRFAARLAALWAAPGSALVVPADEFRAWLADQPLQVLGSPYEGLVGLLERLGIKTLGQLAELPGPLLGARFGPLGAQAWRLASGQEIAPGSLRRPPLELDVQAVLDPPEPRVERVAFLARALSVRMSERLAGASLQAGSVEVEIGLESGESFLRRWRLGAQAAERETADRVRWQLEGLLEGGRARVGGGVAYLRLHPDELQHMGGVQLDLWGALEATRGRPERAVAKVQALLGHEGVLVARLVGGRGPAERVALQPWGDPGPRKPVRRPQGGEPPPPWPGHLPPPAPAVVYQPPLPAHLLDEWGRVVEVSARGQLSAPPSLFRVTSGAAQEVTVWAGPWPLEERWWDRQGRRRAWLQVGLASAQAHLLACEGGTWWVEATYG